MGVHDAGGGPRGGQPLPVDGTSPTGSRRRTRSFVVLVAAASITWLFTVICVIGLAADGESDGRLGFAVLGVPFLVAALATTYAARNIATPGPKAPAVPAAATSALHASLGQLELDDLPGPTSQLLQAMRRSYDDLDAKLTDDERDTEAWRTMTHIVSAIVPETVNAYRRVAGYGDADADFMHSVRLLNQTFDERRSVVTAAMLDELHTETHYIEDRFTPSELTTDASTNGQRPGSN